METNPELIWSHWPAKQRPLVTALVLALFLLMWLACYSWLKNIFITSLLMLAVFIYLAEFFFPTKFGIDSKKVWKKIFIINIEKKWSNLRSYYTDKRGVLISPFTRPSRLETFRGIYLRFDQEKREEILSLIDTYISSQQQEDHQKTQDDSVNRKTGQ